MATLRLLAFSGEIPKLLPRLLPDMSAQRAENTRLEDGGLQPVRRPRSVYSFPPGSDYRTIYLYNGEWLAFESVVSIAPGPVAQDRLYYTGDGAPKMRVSGSVFDLAVPFPQSALSASASGSGDGDGDVQTRVYVYTWVTEYGEESEPSPLSNEVEWRAGQSVTLSGFTTAPANRGISSQRIYRGQSTASGSIDLYFIAERGATNSNFTDNVGIQDIQEPLPSRDWNPPPDDLEGLISLPNGMMAAFSGKTLYFSEPWRPHAWPENYILTTDSEIVGLGAFGTSVVVVTRGNPYIVSGSHPASMVMEKLELNLPCINARSIQDLGYAVAYATHEGLVVVSQGGARIVTQEMMSRDDWQQLNPSLMVSGQYQGRYYASYRYTDARGEERRGTIIIDLTGQQPFRIRSNVQAAAFHFDIESGSLYFLRKGTIYEYDARGEVNEIQSWRSKQYVLPRPTNFGAILVEADDFLTEEELAALERMASEIRQENAQIIATGKLGGAINATPVNTYMVNGDETRPIPSVSQYAAIGVYADGRLVATISTINEMARLPSGFKARSWEIEVSGDMQVSQISLATTGLELMQV